MSEWLELELAHRLAPVAAPDELWQRIEKGRPAARRHPARRPIAAILTLGVAAATLWLAARGHGAVVDLEKLAMEQLRTAAPLDLRSSDPAEIGAWTLERADIPVRLTARGNARLAGVRVIEKRGLRIAAVDYTIGGDTATLLVARSTPGTGSGHGRMSWKSAGLSYGLACSNREHPEVACLLCHTSL